MAITINTGSVLMKKKVDFISDTLAGLEANALNYKNSVILCKDTNDYYHINDVGVITEESNVIKNKNSWKGKKYLAIGDSVTSAINYQYKVGDILDLDTVETHALGGLGITAIIDGSGSLPALTSTQLSDVDVVTFFGGLNDRSALIGNVTDLYPAQNTICGKYNYAINSIYNLASAVNNNKLRLIFIAPHKVGKYGHIDADGGDEYPTGSGQTLEDIVNSLKEVCGLKGVSVVDLYHNSNINEFTWDVLTINTPADPSDTYPLNNDNVHPNDDGHTIISKMVASEISKY